MSRVNYGRLKLLFVDDAPNTRLMLRELLRSTEWPNADFADSAAAALEMIRRNPPDLVFTDWQMPGESGLDLIRSVRAGPDSRDPMLPMILLTANGGTEYVLEARKAGATDFLVKPISRARIVERVISAVTKQRPFIVSPSYTGPDWRRATQPGGGLEPLPPGAIVLPPDGLLLAKVQDDHMAIREAQQRRATAIAIIARQRPPKMESPRLVDPVVVGGAAHREAPAVEPAL
jgi:CheY-like chemotaxis protein